MEILDRFGLVQSGGEPMLIAMSDIKRGNIEEWLAGACFLGYTDQI